MLLFNIWKKEDIMINLQAIICTNGLAILLLLVILQSSRRLSRRRLFDYRIFNIMIGVNITQCSFEIISYSINGIDNPWIIKLNTLIVIFQIINNAIFAFIWVLFADFKLFEDMDRLRKRYKYLAIPALLIIIGSIANLFIPVFFSFSKQDHVYQRTILYIIPNIVVLFYLIYGTIIIYWNKLKVGKYMFMPAIIFMIPIVICSLIDLLFYGISIKMAGVAVALTSVFVNIQNELSYTDSLSGLLTRQYMVTYLTTEIKRSSDSKKIAAIMLDIDKFKSINDNFGHLMGDDAIHSVGQLLHKAVSKENRAFRFAGDEFMVIQLVEKEEEITELISRIRSMTDKFNDNKNKPYVLQFSIGYSIFDKQTDTMDTFLERMDAAMYVEKKKKNI